MFGQTEIHSNDAPRSCIKMVESTFESFHSIILEHNNEEFLNHFHTEQRNVRMEIKSKITRVIISQNTETDNIT